MSQHCLDNLKPGDLIDIEWKINDRFICRTIKMIEFIGSCVYGKDIANLNAYFYNPKTDRLIRIRKKI